MQITVLNSAERWVLGHSRGKVADVELTTHPNLVHRLKKE